MSEQATTMLKFGGTSMESPEVVAEIVRDRDDITGIVVSAPAGMTDRLTTYAQEVVAENNEQAQKLRSEVIDRFEGLYAPLIGSKALKDIRKDLIGELEPVAGLTTEQAEARYASVGEMGSYLFFAESIDAEGLKPVIRFDGDGRYSYADTHQHYEQAWQEGRITVHKKFVTPGYYGVDEVGTRHLLGRGSSDRVGAIHAKELELLAGSSIYENWTDRDGIYTADPNMVPAAVPVSELSRGEVREGAHGGSGILQGDTIVDLDGSNVIVHVRNTKNPDAPGTRILRTREPGPGQPIVAMSGRDDLMEVSITDMAMADTPGYVENRLDSLRQSGLSFQHMPSSQDIFSVTIAAGKEEQRQKVNEFAEAAEANLLTADGTVEIEPKGAVYVVGEGLRNPYKRSMAISRVYGILANKAGLQIEDVISNRKSPSIAFLVDYRTVEDTVRALHSRIIENQYP